MDFKSEISEVKITNDYQLTFQIIYSLFNYLIKISSKNSSITVRNTPTLEGVLIELENNATKVINQKKAPDLNDILNPEENCSGNLDFYLTNHLISLIEGRIIFSNTTNDSSIIQVYIPNKSA